MKILNNILITIMTEFKTGDKLVRIMRPHQDVQVGDIFTVASTCNGYITLRECFGQFAPEFFIPLEKYIDEEFEDRLSYIREILQKTCEEAEKLQVEYDEAIRTTKDSYHDLTSLSTELGE